MAAKTKPILIGCPQYSELVGGQYECDASGQYAMAPDGSFALPRVQCGHRGGRCMQTLCALHRYNRRGAGTWFPSKILAMRDGPGEAARERPAKRRPPKKGRGMDIFC